MLNRIDSLDPRVSVSSLSWCTADVSTGVSSYQVQESGSRGRLEVPGISFFFSCQHEIHLSSAWRIIHMCDWLLDTSVAHISAPAVASLTHTCRQFTFHSFRQGSLKLVGLGGGGNDSQRASQFGRPTQISHCGFICRMPPYMSWDSGTEADVLHVGGTNPPAPSVWKTEEDLKKWTLRIKLWFWNKRGIRGTVQHFTTFDLTSLPQKLLNTRSERRNPRRSTRKCFP